MKTKQITEELDHDLTPDEIREMGKDLAKDEQELNTVLGERLAANQIFRNKIKSVKAEIERKATDIVRKKTARKTKVEIRADPDHARKVYVRLDTNEQIREEAMTEVYVRLDTNEQIREEAMTEGELERARQKDMFPESDAEAEKGAPIEEKKKKKTAAPN